MSSLISCGETIQSTWKNQPLVVDGNAKDWENLPLQYQEKMNLVYGIVNNESTLDIMIRFNDQRLAQIFSMRGFTVWFNGDNQEEKTLGIHYQDKNLSDLTRSRGFIRRPDRNRSPQAFEPKGQFTLAENDSLTGILIKETETFHSSAGYEDGLYCYEFSISLAQIEGSPNYLKISDENEIKIGLEICGLSDEEKEKIKNQMSERKGSGRRGGGMRSGRRDGGRPGDGMRGGARSMPNIDSKEYWISIMLANDFIDTAQH
jgi:hypothetical protein